MSYIFMIRMEKIRRSGPSGCFGMLAFSTMTRLFSGIREHLCFAQAELVYKPNLCG
jgi:hypothetical protein